MTNRIKNLGILGIQALILLILALIWEKLGRSSKDIFFLVGTPTAVIAEFWQLIIKGNFLQNFLITGTETVTGFVIGTTLGTFLGLSLWFSKTIALIARPFVTALGACRAYGKLM